MTVKLYHIHVENVGNMVLNFRTCCDCCAGCENCLPGKSYPILPEMVWSKQPTHLAVDVSPATTEYQKDHGNYRFDDPIALEKSGPKWKESVRPQGVWDVSIRPSNSRVSRGFDHHPVGSRCPKNSTDVQYGSQKLGAYHSPCHMDVVAIFPPKHCRKRKYGHYSSEFILNAVGLIKSRSVPQLRSQGDAP